MRRVKVLAALGMGLLILLSTLLAVLSCVWDADTYAAKSRAAIGGREEKITEIVGMDAPTQRLCALRIRDYFAGRARDMDFLLPDGTHAFNAKELSHMRDVRGLVALGAQVAGVLAALLALCALAWARACRRDAAAAAATVQGMKRGVLALGLIVGLVALWALLDFRAAFELFHRIAFQNDNWLLDPRTDRLIRMMPQPLFETLCVHIALRAAILPAAAGMAAAHRYASQRKREKQA